MAHWRPGLGTRQIKILLQLTLQVKHRCSWQLQGNWGQRCIFYSLATAKGKKMFRVVSVQLSRWIAVSGKKPAKENSGEYTPLSKPLLATVPQLMHTSWGVLLCRALPEVQLSGGGLRIACESVEWRTLSSPLHSVLPVACLQGDTHASQCSALTRGLCRGCEELGFVWLSLNLLLLRLRVCSSCRRGIQVIKIIICGEKAGIRPTKQDAQLDLDHDGGDKSKSWRYQR